MRVLVMVVGEIAGESVSEISDESAGGDCQ